MTGGAETVAVVDLLAVNLRSLLARPFSEQLAQFVQPGSRVRPSRVVLIDRARDLTAHTAVFEHVLGARVDIAVLCVAVGELGTDGILHRPDLLARHDKAATLWIGDPEGIAWGLESSIASAVYGVAGGTPYAMPPALLDALSRPAIFDAVVERARPLGAHAAGVGLRAARVEVSGPRFARAWTAALTQLTSADGAWTREPIKRRAASREIGTASTAIRPGGPVHQDLKTAQQSLAQVRSVLETGRGDLPAAVAALAVSLRAAAEDANQVIEACDPHVTSDPEHRQLFAQLGLDTAASAPNTGNPDLELLAETGLHYLGDGGPLPVLADRFDETANRYGVSIRSPYLQRRQQTGIDLLVARLDTFRSVDALRPTPLVAGITGLLSCVTVLCPGSAAAGAGLAVAGFLGAAGWVRHRLSRIGLRRAFRVGLVRHAGAAAAGTALGAVVSALLSWTVWSGTMRFLGGAVAAAVLSFIIAGSWHRRLLGGLRDYLGTEQIGRALDQTAELINFTARTARHMAELNDEVCNYARSLATLVRDIGGALVDRVQSAEDAVGAGAPSVHQAGIDVTASRELSERMSEIDAVVLRDVGDVAAAVFERFAESVRGGGRIAMPEGDAVRGDVDERLADYLKGVENAGVYRRPADCREPEERERQLATLWAQAGSLPDLVWSGVGDSRITQFCTPEDLGFLENDPRQSVLIPFAPRAAERLIGKPAPSGQLLVWTDESRLLGVLRLVPLRPGVVSDDFQAGAGALPSQKPDWDTGLAVSVPGTELSDLSIDDLDEDF